MAWERAEIEAKKRLVCPLREGREFDRQQGRLDSRWGITCHSSC